MTRISFIPRIATALTALALLGVAAPVESQTRTLSWTEQTTVEVPGALGTLLRMSGATAPRESQHRVHLQGRSLVQEEGDVAVVMDLENNRFLSVDHEARTYFSMGFDESAALTQDVLAQTRTAAAAQPTADLEAAREEMRRTLDEVEATLDMRVSAESTGRSRSFGSNLNATQHFVITEFEATAVPEGVDESVGGSIVLISEMWQTDDVPTSDAMFRSWAEEVAANEQLRAMGEGSAEFASAGEALAESLATWDPRVAAGIRRMADAMSEIQGTTLRSTITVALVPQGTTMDREQLLAWEPESTGDQLRGQAAGAVREAAASAARGALRAAFGRRAPAREPEPEEQADAGPAVRPLFRIVTSREDIAFRESSEDILSSLTARMGDYRAITLGDIQPQP